ncbi:hypothetical protein ACJX0J_018014 [Zea mays]
MLEKQLAAVATAFENAGFSDLFPFVEVLLYISINRKTGAVLEARFNEGFPIFCITSHLKLLEDIGNKFNLIINLNVSIQKAKVHARCRRTIQIASDHYIEKNLGGTRERKPSYMFKETILTALDEGKTGNEKRQDRK